MIRPVIAAPTLFAFALCLTGCEKPAGNTAEAPKAETTTAPAAAKSETPPAAPAAPAAPSPAPAAPASAPTPAAAPSAAADNPTRHEAPDAGISWLNPPGYKTIQDGKPFRVGTIVKEGAPEIAVTKLGAMTGSLEDNINRWRGQVGLPPGRNKEELDAHVRELRVAGVDAVMCDFVGPEGRMLVAQVNDDANRRRFFFKMQDKSPDVIEANKKLFTDTVQSVRLAGK